MITSPLHLENYFFTKLHIDACEKGCESNSEVNLSSHVDCLKHKDDPRKWMVELGLRQDEDKDNCPEYIFHIEVVGLFAVEKNYSDEKAEDLVRVNGPAVLFGAIREMVANLTARGPFPMINLPSVTFIDEIQSSDKKGTTNEH